MFVSDRYDGEWQSDLPHGLGTYTWRLRRELYHGKFAFGQRHGRGRHKFANGDLYVCACVYVCATPSLTSYVPLAHALARSLAHVRACSTTLAFLSFRHARRYDGLWDRDVIDGRGIMTFANGDSYRGSWVNATMHGTGVYTFHAGHRYQGEWFCGRMHGTGIMKYASGHEYEGEWVHNRRTGRGVLR